MDEIKQISIGSKTLSWSEDAVLFTSGDGMLIPATEKSIAGSMFWYSAKDLEMSKLVDIYTVARRKATRPNIGLEILGDRHIMVAKVLMEGMRMGGLSPDVIVATGSCTRKTVGG
jgi:hypothetical protein